MDLGYDRLWRAKGLTEAAQPFVGMNFDEGDVWVGLDANGFDCVDAHVFDSSGANGHSRGQGHAVSTFWLCPLRRAAMPTTRDNGLQLPRPRRGAINCRT